MNNIDQPKVPNFVTDDLLLINKLRIPPLKDPINIKIYWFQARSNNESFFSQSHKHTFFETHFILNGSTTYDINGKRIVSSYGQFILIPANTPHAQLYCSDDLVKLSLSFDIRPNDANELSRVMAKNLEHSPFMCDYFTDEMILTIELICTQSKRKDLFTNFVIRNNIFSLISELYHFATKHQQISASYSVDTTDTRYISAKKFIDDNIYLKLKTEDIATHVHLSNKQINRIFLKYGNISVSEYISNKKHAVAKELLLSTDLSLQQISDKLGYADEFYFNKSFTQKAGITPFKFRKINGNVIKDKDKAKGDIEK